MPPVIFQKMRVFYPRVAFFKRDPRVAFTGSDFFCGGSEWIGTIHGERNGVSEHMRSCGHKQPRTMRSTQYPRIPRAMLCSALLLSHHAVVDANNWATRRASSSRTSTLAVMQPGGRNRPVRDWKAIKREAEDKLAKEAEEKAMEKKQQAGEAVEAVEEKLDEVHEGVDKLETASADVLDLDAGTPQSLGIMLAKVAVVTTVGLYGAKKVVSFVKAFMKARKEAANDVVAGESLAVAPANDDDNHDEGDEEVAEVIGEDAEEEDPAEKGGDEATDGFVTADEDEDISPVASAAATRDNESEAGKDTAQNDEERTTNSLGESETSFAEANSRGNGDGDAEEAEERSVGRVSDGGKVDVSYI